MKNYYQKKLIQVFFVLCLFIDINTFVVHDLQAKETASFYQEFNNFISADDSNYKYNYDHKYNYNLLAQTSFKNSYYPQNIDHANYSLVLPILIKPEVLILSVATMAASFFLYNNNLLQKTWLGDTLLSKTDQSTSHQTDHQTEFFSIGNSSGDSDHINLQQNLQEDPKPVFLHDDLKEDHKEEPSSLFTQSPHNKQNSQNYVSVIKQAVDEKRIDFIKHRIKNESDPREFKYVRSQLDIKTLEYIYQLEKKYFELSLDALKYLLSAYKPGDNYTLSMDKSHLLKTVIDLQDSHAMVRCHLFLSNILKLDDKKLIDILKMYEMISNYQVFSHYKKRIIMNFLRSKHLWQAQEKGAHSVDNKPVNTPVMIYRAFDIEGNSETINQYIDNFKKEFFDFRLDKRNDLMSKYLKDDILKLDNSHTLVFDHIKKRFNDLHLFVFLNTMLNFSEKKITRRKILNLFNINDDSNPHAYIYYAIARVKKHLNKLHHYDLITFTSTESLENFLDGEFNKIISDKNSDVFKKLLKKFQINPDSQNDFIDLIDNFVNDLENEGAYKKSAFINFNIFEHSIHHNVFWDIFADHEVNLNPSSFTMHARKSTLHKFKNALHNHNIYRVFASKPEILEFQNSVVKQLSDFELKLFSNRNEVKNYNKIVLSDKISSFFRQNAVDSDQDKIIFFSKILSIPKIKDHHLTELLSIDQPTLLSLSDDLKSKWHKLYTLSDLSYKSLDDLNHIYESLTESQWDEIFKNFNFSYSSNTDLFSKEDRRQTKKEFNDYYHYILDDDFEKMVFLVIVLKLTHPTEYINDRLFKTYLQSSMKNTNASSSGKIFAYNNKKTAVLSRFLKYLDLNVNRESFASSQALEATMNLRFKSLTNKQWQDMAKAHGVSDTNTFISKVTDYYNSLTNDIKRALFVCRVLGLCAVTRDHVFELYNRYDISLHRSGTKIEANIYKDLKSRLSKIHE